MRGDRTTLVSLFEFADLLFRLVRLSLDNASSGVVFGWGEEKVACWL